MSAIAIVLVVLVGVAAGAALGWLAASVRHGTEIAVLRHRLAGDEQALRSLQAASSQAVSQASEQLVDLAEQRYARLESSAEQQWARQAHAVRERLSELGVRLEAVERQRTSDTAALRTSVERLAEATDLTRTEARSLSNALRSSRARGHWGEVQLRRALEAAGLRPGVDFVEQSGSWDGAGTGRPDVVVRLPWGVNVVIDSKVPLDRYLDACAADDDAEERRLLVEHSKAVHDHVVALSRRNYAELVGGPVDFVAMFLPKEAFLDAAIEHRPGIVDVVQAHRIVPVTPSTVHGLLASVASVWKEHRLAEAAADVQAAGEELYGRVSVFLDHFSKVGRSLATAVGAYNEATGSLEARVLPSARRMARLGVGGTRTLRAVDPLDESVRPLRAAEAPERPERDDRGRQPPGQANVRSIGAVDPSGAARSVAVAPPEPSGSTSVPEPESSDDW
jgi:DNA recombination protein RmuC